MYNVFHIRNIIIMSLLTFYSAWAQNFWQQTNMIPHQSIYSLIADNDGSVYAGTYGNGIYKTTDDGVSWNESNMPGYWGKSMAKNSSGDIFLVGIGSQYGTGVFRTNNNGSSWQKVLDLNGYGGINSIHVANDNTVWIGLNYSMDYHGIYKSTDNGNTWTNIFSDTKNFYDITSKPGGFIFASSYGRVYRSTDYGSSWTYTEQGLPSSQYGQMAVNQAGQVFVATMGYGIFRSDDNGITWSQIKSAGPDQRCLLIDKSGNIYTGETYYGVYRSTDNGANWELINGGLTNKFTLSFTTNKNGYLFLGTDTSGVFRSTQQIVTGVKENFTASKSYKLYQNYPNPFNPSTSITFSIPQREYLTLKVYNSLGEEAAELVSGIMNAGSHTVTFTTKNLASGIYIYKLSGSSFSQTKKMLLLK